MVGNAAKRVAFSGVMAALSMVIMCLGGMIPVATYVCPVLCILVGSVVLDTCGRRIAWVWYAAVAILSALLSPDKEAAAVFVFLGCYPILKRWFDKVRFGNVLKFLYFNSAVIFMYLLLMYLLGMHQLLQDCQEAGAIGLAIMLLLGNVTFWFLDRLLTRITKMFRRKYV